MLFWTKKFHHLKPFNSFSIQFWREKHSNSASEESRWASDCAMCARGAGARARSRSSIYTHARGRRAGGQANGFSENFFVYHVGTGNLVCNRRHFWWHVAIILFSDILFLLEGLGLELKFDPGPKFNSYIFLIGTNAWYLPLMVMIYVKS